MSERLTRKDIKHDIKHDRFIEEVEVAYDVIQRNRIRVIWIAVAALAIAALGFGLYAWKNKKEAAAQTLLSEAIHTMQIPIAGESQQPTPPDTPTFKTNEERLAKAEPQFKEVVTKYPGSEAADVANLYLAQMESARGDIKSAEPKLRKFLDEHGDHVLAGSANLSLYQIELGSGRAKDVAADIDKQLSAEKPNLPKDVLLSIQARAYEQSGDEAKAKSAYQRLINEFPDSPYTLDAQRKVARG
jgi:TolA-binding protein